jgi:signal transduction histidine kinase
MSLRHVFENRSGRVIAVFRATLAVVFFLAVLLDPGAPSHGVPPGRNLLGVYSTMSLAVIALIWRDWWREHQLALPMLALDIGVFLTAAFLSEASRTDFTSPFLAIFALIVLSATVRWDWRAALLTGGLVVALFLMGGLLLANWDVPLAPYRLVRRALYMAALLMVLVRFGVERSDPRVPPLSLPTGERDDETLLWQALDQARALTGAEFGLIGWSAADEPWIQLRACGPAGRRSGRSGPDGLASGEEMRGVRLFDRRRGRKLLLDSASRPRAEALRTPMPLAEWGGIEAGLALPFAGVSGSGLIVLGGIVGPGKDFLALGKAIAREVGMAFDRVAVGRLEGDALVSRTRSAVARDLHDSVAQSLAGACFRLEALRRNVHNNPADAAAAEHEIISVRNALRREQSHIRNLIETLRAPTQAPDRRDLGADINAALADAGAHWGLAVTLEAPGPVDVPGWLSHELQQLVREAAANAARHGRALRLTTRIAHDEGRISLQIADDGCGFDSASNSGQPWSISERVAALGGVLSVQSGPSGTRLAIILPQPTSRNSLA